jgi:hypothetical protein
MIRNWFPGEPLEVPQPGDWYQKGNDIWGWKCCCHLSYPIIESGAYLWQPAPATAKFAVEELWRARLKRQYLMHVFVCPVCSWPSGENNSTRSRMWFLRFSKSRAVLSIVGTTYTLNHLLWQFPPFSNS